MNTQTRMICALLTFSLVVATCAVSFGAPEPGIVTYHVGVDGATEVGYGTYLGLPNPNYNRLSFLLSHTFVETPWSNHFHRIGSYGYSGPVDAPVESLSTNNRVPEPYQGDDGLALLPGSGVFDGMLVSGLGAATYPGDEIEQEYGDLTIMPIDDLFQFDGMAHPDPLVEDPSPLVDGAKHPGNYLINSSSGAYKTSMDGVRVGMELVEISDGLSALDASGAELWGVVGDVVTLGETATWALNPVFAVDGLTAPGEAFSASFKLVDLSDTPQHLDSAVFSFDFIAVPEPATAGLVLLMGAGVATRRRV